MIYTLLAEGFEEIEAITVVDILRRAEIPVEFVSVNESKTVTGAHGITVIADKTINETEDIQDIFLPGGYPGYVNLKNNKKVMSMLFDAVQINKMVVAICAAPSILGSAGVLDNKVACCFPGFEKELIGAQVTYDDVVVSDNIITSRGAGTAHKLGFKLVEIIKGKEFADNLSKTMIY